MEYKVSSFIVFYKVLSIIHFYINIFHPLSTIIHYSPSFPPTFFHHRRINLRTRKYERNGGGTMTSVDVRDTKIRVTLQKAFFAFHLFIPLFFLYSLCLRLDFRRFRRSLSDSKTVERDISFSFLSLPLRPHRGRNAETARTPDKE